MNYDKTNGVGGKAANRGVSRGAGIAGRGSSKILQRSNIISNNNGTPNLKGNKSKIAQAISGQAPGEDSKFPYGNSIESAVDKDLDIFGNKREANQALGAMSKYNNKSKSIIGGKGPENHYDSSSLQMELNKELMDEVQQLRE